MAEFSAMPLWTDAYLGDTTHLTTIEHGAYLLLLMAAWRSKDGCLPDNDVLLARFTHTTNGQWKKIRPILESFFRIENGCWVQGRLMDEREAVRQNSKRASDNAKARWLKTKETGDEGALPDGCKPDAPIPTPLPIPQGVNPPTPQAGGDGVFNSGKGKGVSSGRFSIEAVLSDDAVMNAKQSAKGWDIYALMRTYDEGVNSGKRSPPTYPEKAFPSWCANYTKGKPP